VEDLSPQVSFRCIDELVDLLGLVLVHHSGLLHASDVGSICELLVDS
jgi:hypothetical protein